VGVVREGRKEEKKKGRKEENLEVVEAGSELVRHVKPMNIVTVI